MTRRALNPSIFFCLHHDLDHDGEHGRVEGRFLVPAEAGTEPCPRLRYARNEVTKGFFLMDLRVSARYPRHVAGAELLLYDPLVYRLRRTVDLPLARAMTLTLAKAQKGLAKIRVAEGWCDDFATFIFRLGRVFGAKVVIFPDDNITLDTSSYVEVTPESLLAQIERWQAEPGPTRDEKGGADEQTR